MDKAEYVFYKLAQAEAASKAVNDSINTNNKMGKIINLNGKASVPANEVKKNSIFDEAGKLNLT